VRKAISTDPMLSLCTAWSLV